MPSFLRNISPTRIAVFLILAVIGYRFWFVTQIGLVGDEAYYWLWSKHLAASYRDKGPAIAWTIALGTKMFGDTVFGIRFFAVLLSGAISWLLFVLARRLYDERTALWCLLVSLVTPMLAVGSILMTIDSLSMFFWALAVLLFWDALHNGRTSTWFWLGLAIGAGFLAKFTNGVQLVCIALFLLWSKEHRPLLFSWKTFLMVAAFGVASTPILWWNIQTGWVHLAALHSRSGVTNTFQIHPLQLLRFVGEQFGVLSPLFMAGIVVAAVALVLRRDDDVRRRFLLSQFLPVYGLFLFFSLNSAGKANWIVPALFTAIIFTVVYWRELVARRPRWRWAVGAAFAIALLMTLAMHDTEILHLPQRLDPLFRAQGWRDFAARLEKDRVAERANLLLASHYSIASLMAFYLPDQPTTYLVPAPYGSSQFTLWPGYQVTPDTRALFVTSSIRPLPPALLQQFTRIELVDDFWSQHHGHPMNYIRVYFCTR
ncbi:MAG: glycosyltransferase family 39 protein [Verrucomicrobiota bacterium]|jgi:4-amino-4-deoxy-L-arabinose transferase-like glycosyltransferase